MCVNLLCKNYFEIKIFFKIIIICIKLYKLCVSNYEFLLAFETKDDLFAFELFFFLKKNKH